MLQHAACYNSKPFALRNAPNRTFFGKLNWPRSTITCKKWRWIFGTQLRGRKAQATQKEQGRPSVQSFNRREYQQARVHLREWSVQRPLRHKVCPNFSVLNFGRLHCFQCVSTLRRQLNSRIANLSRISKVCMLFIKKVHIPLFLQKSNSTGMRWDPVVDLWLAGEARLNRALWLRHHTQSTVIRPFDQAQEGDKRATQGFLRLRYD